MENSITFEWFAVLPETILMVTAMILLLFASFARARTNTLIRVLAIFGLLVAVCTQIPQTISQSASDYSFGGLLESSSPFSYFIMLCALLTLTIHPRSESKAGEFGAVVLICTAALSLFVRAQNLFLAFVALECATLCLYVLVGWQKKSATSLEAAIRYLIVGGASGAILLMGIAFLYGASFSSGINLLDISKLGAASGNPLMWTGMVFLSAGLFFKIAAFPFQFWAPNVYQGAPTSVSAFLAVASKGAGVVFFVKVCAALAAATLDDIELNSKLVLVVSVISAITIIVGNLGGITQINAKRLLAFSGISNAGYLLVLAAAVLQTGMSEFAMLSLAYYLLAYMLANYGVFCSIGGFNPDEQAQINLGDFRGMFVNNRRETIGLITNLSSLAGIPPTAGFFGKVLILMLAWNAQLYWLMGVMICGSVVSIYYYFAWIRAAVEPPSEGGFDFEISQMRASSMLSISVCTLLLGVFVLALSLL